MGDSNDGVGSAVYDPAGDEGPGEDELVDGDLVAATVGVGVGDGAMGDGAGGGTEPGTSTRNDMISPNSEIS